MKLLGKLACIASSITLFTGMAVANPEQQERNKEESSKSCVSRVETSVTGQVHLYGNRYIVKDHDSKQWFILLENDALEQFLQTLGEMEMCQIEGERYQFKNNRYLLPRHFVKVKTTSQESFPFGLLDTDYNTGQIHVEDDGDDHQMQGGGQSEKSEKKVKKSKKSKKSKKEAKKNKKNKNNDKGVKKQKKNGKDKKETKKQKKNGKDKKETKKQKKNGKDKKETKKQKKNGKKNVQPAR